MLHTAFFVLTVCVCVFWQNDIALKAAHKMYMKLTTGLQRKIRDGYYTKMKMFFPNQEPYFWTVSADKALCLTKVESEAKNFKIGAVGESSDQVQICTEDLEFIVFVDENKQLKIRPTSSFSLNDCNFGIEMVYGEDLAVLTHKGENECVVYSADKHLSIGHLRRGNEILPGSYDRELKSMILFHPWDENVTFYLSMNMIVNSMRYEKEKNQMLSCDETFHQLLIDGSWHKHIIDDILTAEYSFCLLITKAFVTCSPDDLNGPIFEIIKHKFDKFREELKNCQRKSVISVDTWDFYIENKLTELDGKVKSLENYVLTKEKSEESLHFQLQLNLYRAAKNLEQNYCNF